MIRITKATPKAIRYACINFHYAKSVPATKYSYNVYNSRDEWCGVILFSSGATPEIGKPFGLVQGEILELVRVALNGKQDHTSECVSAALKQLHHDAPQVKIVVSYADKDQNHNGIIYQATNWIYLGVSKMDGKGWFVINGKKMHPKSVYSNGWKQSIEWLKQNVDADAYLVKMTGKHKYIYVFDKRLRKKHLKEVQPYPKNDVQK